MMKKNILLFILFLTCFFIHLLWIKFTKWQFRASLIQKKVLIQGTIDLPPQKKFKGNRFQFHTTELNHQKINTHFLISWYQHAPNIKIGDRWELLVKLKPPVGMHNPMGFDYEKYLLSRGITATGYVVSKSSRNKWLSHSSFYFLQSLRQNIQTHIGNAINDPSLAAFISAICVGLRDGLTELDWRVFQNTGTNHLVAIAGLHIGFVFASIYFLVNFCWRYFPRLLSFIPAQRIAELTALAVSIGYAALSGFAVPALRAILMLIFLIMGKIATPSFSPFKRLIFAGCIILILEPESMVDASFWLSFSMMIILIMVMSGRLGTTTHLKNWGRMQLAVLIGIVPFSFYFFQTISLVGFFTNAIAIPWIGFLILPIALISSLLLICHFYLVSHYLFWVASKLLCPLWKFLVLTSTLSFATWHHGLCNIWILLLGFVGVFFLLLPKGFPKKYVGCFGLLPLFFYHPSNPKFGSYWITVIDVGQGLSVLVQTAHHVLLYDAGPHIPGGFDVGESVVAPYLRTEGITHINRLEISHGDNDHSGGANAIVKNFKVSSIYSSAPKIISHFHAVFCHEGQNWIWDGVIFKTLNPTQNSVYEDNNSSCVIQMVGKAGKTLLTGDIQKSTEGLLIKKYGSELQSDLLISPHHGSRTSSSLLFLQAVSPHIAVISAGKYNRYHLPAKSVILRYQQQHIKTYITADRGGIKIKF